ncbi:MAG: cupin domain-containing protein [Anaerolineae bacterium]|nr:cupin domain-containing protein [Chloroflexota bacterium]
MQVVQASGVASSPNPHGVRSQVLWNSDDVQAVMITIQPGQAMLSHITPVDVLFYGLEGEGTVEVGDETTPVGVDTLVFSPKGIPHRPANLEGTVPFRFLVIKTPHPRLAQTAR